MPSRASLLFLGVALVVIGGAPAQGFDFLDEARPAFRIFTDQDGLPQNAITAMVVDKDRYIWASTKDGLARYDGREWTPFNLPPEVGSNWVQSLDVGHDGALWLGTYGGGLLKLQAGSWTHHGKETNGFPDDKVHAVADTAGTGGTTVWAGTDAGLFAFEGEAWRAVDLLPGERPVVTALFEASNGDLWAGSFGHGMFRLSKGVWDHFPATVSRFNSIVETTVFGRQLIAAGTFGDGLYLFDGKNWQSASEFGLQERTIHYLCETTRPDGGKVLWAGAPVGLWRYSGGFWRRFTQEAGLPPTGIWSLAQVVSPNGTLSLWIGTSGGGIVRWQLGRWGAFDTANGLPSASSYAVLVTVADGGKETLWVGTGNGGLAEISEGIRTFHIPMSRVPQVSIWCLAETETRAGAKAIWAGTNTGGLARYEAGKWSYYGLDSGLPGMKVNALLPTRGPAGEVRIWVATAGGLGLIEDDRAVPVPPGILLAGMNVMCLLETESATGKVLWVGLESGLLRYENGEVRRYDRSNGLPNDTVMSLREMRRGDGEREVWVGTRGGVARLGLDSKQENWTYITSSNVPAMPNNTIYRIELDRYGRVYLFTNRGVARLTPRSPDSSNPAEFSIYVFTTEDGLPSNECNTGASTVDYRGRIWAGTIAGVGVFDPSTEIEDNEAKPLHVERALLPEFGLVLNPGDSLAYDENHVLFEFALLSYFRGADTRFRTQLVGFDDQASAWTADRKKEYTSLPAGEYQFMVWGVDALGNVTGPVVIPFTVRPAPWLTWWAYALYAIAAIAAAVGIGRYRTLSLRSRNVQLEQKIAVRTAELGTLVEDLRASEHAAQEAKAAALEANRAKSVFLANMSHELRTPLNAIIGFVQLLERDRGLSNEQRETLGIVARSGDHLLALINDVLSIAKIEAGRVTLQEETFDVYRLLQSVREMIQVRADAKQIALNVEIDENLPAAVRGDEAKLRQILINLLGNAVKFTHSGAVTLRLTYRAGTAQFEVSDTGAGISEADLGRLFQAFVQTSAGNKADEGTGLGLVISRTYVWLMGGELKVQSELGRGSTFSFAIDLPESAHEEVARRMRRARALVDGEGSRRVLVVDDRLENRVLLSRLLTSVGFEVRTASNGAEAVAEWEAWSPDLIWMDMRMPVMDGVAATRAIREREDASTEGARTRIIALTASAFEHEKNQYLSIGCDDFVAKPFQASAIFEKVAEHLGVEYVYEDDGYGEDAVPVGDLVTRERFEAVPPEKRRALAMAVTAGDVAEAQRAVDAIGSDDEALAAEIRALVHAYRFDEIIDALESEREEEAT